MHWFAMAIPIATAAVLYWKYRDLAVWWEFLIVFFISAILIFVSKFCVNKIQTTDIEYWGGWIVAGEYYEAWNERVPCTHDKYEEYTDSDGKTHSRYVGKEHLYDVDYHPEYWQVLESNGEVICVDYSHFGYLASKFGNKIFVDMHRSYHTIDGDKYVTSWKLNDEDFEPAVTSHFYENKVQASNSVFRFRDVDKTEVKSYCLFGFPKITGYYSCPCILGDGGPTHFEAEKKLEVWNAKLGAIKEVRMMILVFKNQPMQAGFFQEQYWDGGNKNEFIICIGVDDNYNIEWCCSFSWTEVEELKTNANSFVMSLGKLDLVRIVDWLVPEIRTKWQRKHFSDFNYLTVDPPTWAVGLIFIITIALNVGLGAWIVKNQYREGYPFGTRGRYSFNRYRR
jgi:hypothetical protein